MKVIFKKIIARFRNFFLQKCELIKKNRQNNNDMVNQICKIKFGKKLYNNWEKYFYIMFKILRIIIVHEGIKSIYKNV